MAVPPSLPSIPDDDFLALLQKQFTANNPATIDYAPFGSKHLPMHVPNSADPQALSRMPIPAPASTTPPLTDSSPSPPSADNQSLERANRRDSANLNQVWANVNGRADDDALKRKASTDDSDDEDDTQRNPKSQHVDRSNSKKAPSRRKSTGNPAADESRLLKRKEQNRAAQRAFRERKERHVKDLEDRVAALEAKNNSTEAENESLRELLQRLQSENLLLKRSAFTFSVPPGSSTVSANGNAPTSGAARSASDSPSESHPMKLAPTAGSIASNSSRESPNSLFEEPYSDMRLYSTPSSAPDNSPKSLYHENSFTAGASHPVYRSTSLPTSNWFGVGPTTPRDEQPIHMPFTIISSNPTYMSYREPSAPTNPYASLHGMSSSVPQQSFVPPPTQHTAPPPVQQQPSPPQSIQQQSQATPQLPPEVQMFSPQDVTMSSNTSSFGDFGGFGGFSPLATGTSSAADLEELFGGQFTSLVPFSPFSEGLSPPSQGSSSKPSPPTRQDIVTSPAEKYHHDASGCPTNKAEMAQMINAEGRSTFGPTSQSVPMNTSGSLLTFEGENGEHLKLDGLTLPRTAKSDANIDAASAWKSVSGHPQFQECDISGLCQEFAAKARCDGSRAVVDRDGIQELVDSIPSRALAHKQGI